MKRCTGFRRKLNNAGLSIVELVVVMAIMVVVVGGGISLFGLIPRSQADSATKDLGAMIEKTKNNAMGFQQVELQITQDGTGVYAQLRKLDPSSGVMVNEGGRVMMGTSHVMLRYQFEGESLTALGDDVMTISFDRSSGAFNKTKVDAVEGSLVKLIITRGTYSRTIDLVELTGKISY